MASLYSPYYLAAWTELINNGFKSNEVDKYGHPIMFKVKTQAWLDKLKTFCKGDEELFRKLL